MIQADPKCLCLLTLAFHPTLRAHTRNLERLIPLRMEHKDLHAQFVALLFAPHQHRIPHLLAVKPANSLSNGN